MQDSTSYYEMEKNLVIDYGWKMKTLHFKILLHLKTMIATRLCSTYNIKSNRNQLNAKSRTFMDKDDTSFGFKPIVDAHERYTKRSSKLTKLTIASAIPDLWNKMNVSAGKIQFTYERITEIFCHFGEQLQCQDYMKLNGSFTESKDITHINFKRLDIINDALQKKLMRFHH